MAYAAAFLGIVAAAAPVGGSPYSERSPHHQRLYDAYETSKTLCSHGHSGVIITLYGRSQKTPEEFMRHLRSNAHATDSFGHVFSSPHTIRAISARLSARTLEQMMKDGQQHGVKAVHADCFHKVGHEHDLLQTQGSPSKPVSKLVSSHQISTLSGTQEAPANWGLHHGSTLGGMLGVSEPETFASGHITDEYVYGAATGKNTILYSVDTGVQMTHHEFTNCATNRGSRILRGWSMGCPDEHSEDKEIQVNCATQWVFGGNVTDEALDRKNVIYDDQQATAMSQATMINANAVKGDTVHTRNSYTWPGHGCDAHGTHTSSIAVGCKYGVAKEASLVVVQGLSCTSTAQDSLVVKALEMIVEDARARKPYMPGVVVLSLGGEKDTPLNEAVKRTTLHHIPVVVAAGNSHTDSCTTTPSAVVAATTVAAIDESNTLTSFSSYGRCVDLAAPGMSITAAYALVGSNDGTAQMSGTSMAAPFVAGAYLQALSLYPQMTSSQAMSLLRCVATKGIMRGDMISVNADTPNVMVRFGEVFASTQNVLAVVNQTFMVAMESMAEAEVQSLSVIGPKRLFKLGAKSVASEELKNDCVELVNMLHSTRPAGGQLAKSPDVNYESVDMGDEFFDPRDEQTNKPYFEKEMATKKAHLPAHHTVDAKKAHLARKIGALSPQPL